MDKLDLVIRGGTVVTGSDEYAADVGVRDGRVVALGKLDEAAEHVVDARGMLVMPGGVDNHVHVDQPAPGVVMCDDFDTGTASAAAGGPPRSSAFRGRRRASPSPPSRPIIIKRQGRRGSTTPST